MPWRTALTAILLGLATTLVFAALVSEPKVIGWVQEPVAYIMPSAVPDLVYAGVIDGLVLAVRALPGILVAVMVVVRARSRGDGNTRRGGCGHILKGLTEPRCPECGTQV